MVSEVTCYNVDGAISSECGQFRYIWGGEDDSKLHFLPTVEPLLLLPTYLHPELLPASLRTTGLRVRIADLSSGCLTEEVAVWIVTLSMGSVLADPSDRGKVCMEV